MSISQNRINPSSTNLTKNTPKNNSPKSNSSTSKFDLSDLHEAAQNFERDIDAHAKKYNPPKIDPSKLNFFERFLHDNWGIRTFFALGNEIAESFYELADHILPKPVAKALYGTLWSLAVVATGSRVTMNAKMAKKEDRIKAGAKMLLHDGISAIAFPTAVARMANFIQNKIYKPLPVPIFLKHLVKSIVSILACKYTIHWLDPKAMELSGNMLKHKNDRHKEINLALGNGHKDKHFAQAA